jgi:hypothetical protein
MQRECPSKQQDDTAINFVDHSKFLGVWLDKNLKWSIYIYIYIYTQKKIRGPQTASDLYRLIDRHLWTKFRANFCG